MRLRRAKPFELENRAAQNPNFGSIFLCVTYWFRVYPKHESCSFLSPCFVRKTLAQSDQCSSSYAQTNVGCQNCRWSWSVLSMNFGPIFSYALYWFKLWSQHKSWSLMYWLSIAFGISWFSFVSKELWSFKHTLSVSLNMKFWNCLSQFWPIPIEIWVEVPSWKL